MALGEGAGVGVVACGVQFLLLVGETLQLQLDLVAFGQDLRHL